MDQFAIPRPFTGDSVPHLKEPLPAVRIPSIKEISAALSTGLRFSLSEPVLLVLGTLPAQTTQQEICYRYCAEVIVPMAERHHVVVVTDGRRGGLAQVLGDLRETCSFGLLGVKRAGTGDVSGEDVDLSHSHLLTLEGVSEEEMLLARIKTIRALAQEIGPVYHQAIVVCMGGDESTWENLRTVLQAHLHVLVLGGSGGVAGEIARVHTYQQEIHRVYPWGIPRSEPSYPLETLSLQAAGLLSLYNRAEQRMRISVVNEDESTDYLYSRLKSEFRIHLKD